MLPPAKGWKFASETALTAGRAASKRAFRLIVERALGVWRSSTVSFEKYSTG
jgi:hypothetical protein